MIFSNPGKADEWVVVWTIALDHARELHRAVLQHGRRRLGGGARQRGTTQHRELQIPGKQRLATEKIHEPSRWWAKIVVRKIHDHSSHHGRRSQLRRREENEHLREL